MNNNYIQITIKNINSNYFIYIYNSFFEKNSIYYFLKNIFRILTL